MKFFVTSTKFLNLLLVIVCFEANSQQFSWQWAISFGGNANDVIAEIAVDDNENLYATGYFQSDTIRIGDITLIRTNQYSQFFLLKCDKYGNVMWAKQSYGNAVSVGSGIGTDKYGNVYVCGNFRNDSVIFDNLVLHNNGDPFSFSTFLVKYDPNGNVLWARSSYSADVAVHKSFTDRQGNTYLAGNFYGLIAIFENDTIWNINPSWYYTDFFIVKYDSSGNVKMLNSGGSNSYDGIGDIYVDSENKILVIGGFTGSIAYLDEQTVTNLYPGSADIFVAEYDQEGEAQWAISAGSNSEDYGFCITRKSDEIIIAGVFGGNSIQLGKNILYETAGDRFIAKLNPSGNVEWANYIGTGYGVINAISIAGDSIIAAGRFNDEFLFGNYTFEPIGSADIFLVSYDNFGNQGWAIQAGGSGVDEIKDLSVTANAIYCGGTFSSDQIQFDTTLLSNEDISSYDFFLGRWGLPISQDPIDTTISSVLMLPNPADQSVTFYISSNSEKSSNFMICNYLGQFILNFNYFLQPGYNEFQINVSMLAPGLYFLTEANGLIEANKLIIQHTH